MSNQDYISSNVFEKEVTFTDQMRKYQNNKKIRGNHRLSSGKYYTDAEKEKYKKESLDRLLP